MHTQRPSLAVAALDRAFDALQEAAADLTIAVAVSPPGSAVRRDALTLARAIELDVMAVREVALRHR